MSDIGYLTGGSSTHRLGSVSQMAMLGGPGIGAPPASAGEVSPILYDFAGNNYPAVSVSRNSAGFARDLAGNLISFAANTLRRTDRGARLEPARTNQTLQNITFDSATWGKNNTTITPNVAATMAPDGTQTADKFTPGASVTGFMNQSTPMISGSTYSQSIYSKPAELTGHTIYYPGTFFSDGLVRTVVFNLSTGGVTYTGVTGSELSGYAEVLANGWYRLVVIITPNAGTTGQSLAGSPRYAQAVGTTGSAGFYIWGAQTELGNYPSTLTISTTAAVTRPADVATITIPANYSQGIYTFDDNTTQTVSVSAGSYTLLTNAKQIKSFELRQ